MDIAQDHKHHRKTQQRIQTKNKAHGDRGRGEILLYPPRLYCSKNGTALEVKPHWKGAQKPASLEDFGAVKIYTIYLTLPSLAKPSEHRTVVGNLLLLCRKSKVPAAARARRWGNRIRTRKDQ